MTPTQGPTTTAGLPTQRSYSTMAFAISSISAFSCSAWNPWATSSFSGVGASAGDFFCGWAGCRDERESAGFGVEEEEESPPFRCGRLCSSCSSSSPAPWGGRSPTETPVTMLSVAVGDHLRLRAGKTRAADTRRGVVVVGRCYHRVWVCKDLARTNVTALWVRHSRLQLSRPHPSTLRMALRGLLLCCASVQQRRACGYWAKNSIEKLLPNYQLCVETNKGM